MSVVVLILWLVIAWAWELAELGLLHGRHPVPRWILVQIRVALWLDTTVGNFSERSFC